MKLWRISQSVNRGYDTYDSAVVAAPDETTARTLHPSGRNIAGRLAQYGNDGWRVDESRYSSGWADSPADVVAEYLGEAKEGTEMDVIVASFNAG